MQEDEKMPSENNEEVHNIADGKMSVVDNIRLMNEKKRRAELDEESRAAEAIAEKDRAERERYAKKLESDRRELMKLKAGLSEDAPKAEEPKRVYSTKEKISNFFYHNKWYVIFGAFIAVLAVFLIHDIATNYRPDVCVMFIATDPEAEFYTSDMEELLEQYCEDYNGDGQIYVRVSYLPAIVDTSEGSVGLYNAQTYQTKLVAEFQSVDSIIVITDDETCETVGIDENGVLADMTMFFPDDKNATDIGYMLNGTNFSADIGYEFADDLYVGFRAPTEGYLTSLEKFQKNFDNAMAMWKNYLNGTVVNPKQ